MYAKSFPERLSRIIQRQNLTPCMTIFDDHHATILRSLKGLQTMPYNAAHSLLRPLIRAKIGQIQRLPPKDAIRLFAKPAKVRARTYIKPVTDKLKSRSHTSHGPPSLPQRSSHTAHRLHPKTPMPTDHPPNPPSGKYTKERSSPEAS